MQPETFIRAAATCASLAAAHGAAIDAVESIVARGAAHAARLMADNAITVSGRTATPPTEVS